MGKLRIGKINREFSNASHQISDIRFLGEHSIVHFMICLSKQQGCTKILQLEWTIAPMDVLITQYKEN